MDGYLVRVHACNPSAQDHAGEKDEQNDKTIFSGDKIKSDVSIDPIICFNLRMKL